MSISFFENGGYGANGPLCLHKVHLKALASCVTVCMYSFFVCSIFEGRASYKKD